MAVTALLVLSALPVVLWTTYLGMLALLSLGRVEAPAAPPGPRTPFDVIVPAHNEEGGIASTVKNLLAVDYPQASRRVVVVADNCLDETVARAKAAGALVLERNDASLPGKGYALAHAFERSMSDGFAVAVVVVDADTHVTPNLLTAFDARVRSGARAIQAEYRVSNPEASWRTRLMRIGFALFHDVRSRGRERMGVSAGLRGNGMGFALSLLREVPHEAYSIVEDVEYGIRLGVAGCRVEYAGECQVFGEMVSSEAASRSQRRRWEGGRMALVRLHAMHLLREALRRRSLLLLDLAADLLVPPLTYVVLAAGVGAMAAVAWSAWAHAGLWPVLPWAVAWVGLVLYVARGIRLARVGPRVILDLAWAPVYMVWKVALALRPSPVDRKKWVRTTREGEKP